MESSDYSKAGDLLTGLIDILGGGADVAKLFLAWKSICGDDIASHSAIEDIRNGTIIIIVDHPAWLQLIKQKELHLLKRMRREFPSLEISHMLCKIGKPQILQSTVEITKHKENKSQQTVAITKKNSNNSSKKEEKTVSDSDLLKSLESLRKTIESKPGSDS